MAQRRRLRSAVWLFPVLLLLGAVAAHGAKITHSRKSDTGEPVWKWRGPEASLKVVGRLPEQTRAFFLGRGFPDKAARRFSESCVIHVTLRNLGDSGLSYRLGRWRVRLPDNAHPPEAEADWEARWRRMGVPKRGRTAFDWSMFPPEENLGAEGWALGMVSLGLKPGRHFDLVAHWRRDGQPHKVVMKDLVCPANGTKTSTR